MVVRLLPDPGPPLGKPKARSNQESGEADFGIQPSSALPTSCGSRSRGLRRVAERGGSGLCRARDPMFGHSWI